MCYRKIIIIYFLSLSFSSLAQNTAVDTDTITVFFDVGSSKVKKVFQDVIDKLPESYQFDRVDSLKFLGYADSTGNWNLNQKLSEKRVQNVFQACGQGLQMSYPYTLSAFGEQPKGDLSNNRKVEIIIYYKVEAQPEETIVDVDPKCFKVDLQALSYCHISEVKKGRRIYVRIEAIDLDIFTKQKHYYLQNVYDGKAVIKRVRWKRKMTGKDWWRERRLVAEIPKKGFDKFQFFTLFNAPCDSCTEDYFSDDTITIAYRMPYFYLDAFLMSNMQVKNGFFNNKKVKVKVPKIYVNPNEVFLMDGMPGRYIYFRNEKYMHTQYPTIAWYTKKRKKHQDYYFAKLNTKSGQQPIFYKSIVTLECFNYYNWPRYGWWWNDWWPFCGTHLYRSINLDPNLSFETGVYRHNDTATAFISAGVEFNKGKWEATFLGGINSRAGFYGNARVRYHFLNFKILPMLKKGGYQSVWENRSVGSFTTLYIGAETTTSFHKKHHTFFDVGSHLGISFTRPFKSKYSNILYLQYGFARDMMEEINSKVYGTGRVGLVFNLF